MITKEDARRLVTAQINEPDPWWPDRPEFIVTSIEEHRLGWLIGYDSRPHHETGEFQHMILGNAPYLVSSVDGSLHVTGTAPPFAERLREAEVRLERHLAEINQAEQGVGGQPLIIPSSNPSPLSNGGGATT